MKKHLGDLKYNDTNITNRLNQDRNAPHFTLHIENLCFKCIIGLLPKEREKPQKILINAEIDYIFNDRFIDYALVATFIKRSCKTYRYELLESALLDISKRLKGRFSAIKRVKLCIKKLAILSPSIVGVSLETYY